MVQIHLKRGDESLFLHSCPVTSSLGEVIPALAKLHNNRKRLDRLVTATQDLLLYGPEKPENEKGYTEEQMEELAQRQQQEKMTGESSNQQHLGKEIHKNGFTFYEVTCPTGTRVGLAAGSDAVGVVQPTLDAAIKITSKDYVKTSQNLEESILKEAFQNIKGALTIIYPEGLPAWDPSRLAIEDDEELEGTAASKEVYNPSEASFWWAGKEMLREKTLSDYVGRNDKTKVIIKLQKKGQGPPVREAPVGEQEQKNMMAYYYKKQEEMKKLEENEDDDYLNSSWADPKSLKSAFSGVGGNVKFR